MGDLTYIQWRRLSTDGQREVLVRFAGARNAGQKRYVVRSLDELPDDLAERLHKEWCEPTPAMPPHLAHHAVPRHSVVPPTRPPNSE